MNADPNQAKAIFLEAVEKHPAEQWPAFLDRACAGEPALRRRVEVLLAAHREAGTAEHQIAAEGPVSVVTGSVEGPGTVVGPYKLLQQIGEGGMGTVWMAEQTEPVQRKVALKLIKSGMDSKQVIARFEAERQALALMDHPNIAKVLDAGTTEGGRPYFVMELVKGVTIIKYCDEHRLKPKQRLELFVPVCQAVQHAHQKGIIHRDLKPSNVMVCLYDGKPVPKVIDFGVAKATGQKLTERTMFTEIGQVVGTLEYMSPEQAELNQLDIDTRSDIYSLGVLLYELLTGTTPLERRRFQAVAFLEVLRLIREEESPRPSTRLSTAEGLPSIAANRGLEPKKLSGLIRGELDWIVMKTLEKDRNRRYESANGFAQDIQRYLADEPVLACPPSTGYRFRKFARRHKAGLRIAAAAALVLLLAGGGVSWALWDQAMRRTELSERMAETEKTVNAALIKTEQWGKQAGKAPSATSQDADAVLMLWLQAEAALGPAESALRTGAADDRLRRRVQDELRQIKQQRAQAQRTANLLRDLDEAQMTRSIWIETHFDYAGAAMKYAAAFAAYGLEVTPGRTAELARRIRAEPHGIREALIVALEDWRYAAALAQTAELAKLVWAIAAAADDDPWRRKYRAAAAARDATALRTLSGEARRLSLPPSSLLLLAVSLNIQGDRDEALALLRWARGRHLTDFWLHYELGTCLRQGKVKSPVILEEAIGCFRTALALRPAASAAHVNFGNCLRDQNQSDESIRSFSQAIELDSKNVIAWNNRGIAYGYLKQWDRALANFTKAIDLDPKFATSHNNIGLALRGKNQLDEASAEFHMAIDLDPKYAAPHYNLGLVMAAKNQWDAAIEEYRKAINLDPKYAPAYYMLGCILAAKNQWDAAIEEYRKAINLDPEDAPAHNELGNVLRAKNQLDEAMGEYRKAIDLDPKYAAPHNGLGAILCDVKHDYDGAIIEFRKAIDLDPKLALAHNNLGNVLGAKNQLDEAIAEYRKAVDLDPKLALAHYGLVNAHYNLGNALRNKKDVEGAIREYEAALKINPNWAEIHCNLGIALFDKKDVEGAIRESEAALKINPNLANAHYNLGRALRDKKDVEGAIRAYEAALKINPNWAEAHCNLANILRFQGQLSASLDFYKRGHALGSKRKDWHYPSEQWVANAERLLRLEVKLADVLAGKATPTDNRERLGLLEVCGLKRRHVAATRLYADAFDVDPQLADDLKACHRYNAACSAALAAAGQGTDAGQLNGQEHSRLRKQALAWLRADLALWSKRLEGGKPEDRQFARTTLQHWQRDSDLAGVRDADALKKLSAEEQEPWRKLWADVAELLKKAANAK